jgi:hypothetical protein
MSPTARVIDLEALAVIANGRVITGVIRGGEAHLSLSLDIPGIEMLNLVILFLDREPEWVPLDTSNAGGVESTRRVPLPHGNIFKSMVVVACVDGKYFRISEDPKHFFLRHLLFQSLDEVNLNLRWHTRIGDLDTRFFTALNSIAATPGNYELHARCMVSFGYKAIEADRIEMVEWSRQFCHQRIDEMMATPDVQVRASVIVFWIHEAIWNCRVDDIILISEIITDSLRNIENYPKGTYNSLHAILLIGSYLLFAGKPRKAVKVFQPFDEHFRIAADKYKRSVPNYREIAKIAQCTYLCKLGLEMARGREIPGNLSSLSPREAWENGQRFRDKKVRQEGCKRYLRLIELSRDS